MASVKPPIISKIYKDPENFEPRLKKVDRDINARYKRFGKELRRYIEDTLTQLGSPMAGNASVTLWFDGDDEFTVNASRWDYRIGASDYARITDFIQALIDEWILGLGTFEFGFEQFSGWYINDEYHRGTRLSFNNLANQSGLYDETQSLQAILLSPQYQERVGMALQQSYDEWTSLTQQLRGRLGTIIGEGIAAGVAPRELAKELVEQGVKPGTASNLARTEMIGALRRARLAEGERARNELGLNTKYLWLSALSMTTRPWHASRHGKLYTADEINEFYSQRGNRFNCKCSFTEALVDEDGNMISKGLQARMVKQRDAWQEILVKKKAA